LSAQLLGLFPLVSKLVCLWPLAPCGESRLRSTRGPWHARPNRRPPPGATIGGQWLFRLPFQPAPAPWQV